MTQLDNYTARHPGFMASHAVHMSHNSTVTLPQTDPIIAEIQGRVGFISLNRPAALNALSLGMIRGITRCLLEWRDNDAVQAVAMRGMSKAGPFGAFCAGGDIRFFHQAVLAGNPELEDFFTEEYSLNHLIHHYPKPTVAFMDGIVMGGGMGLSQGMTIRLVTEHTKMAMPETLIGLFPDVGGGYFLSRCPGHIGEWLALTGDFVSKGDAVAFGLADAVVDSSSLVPLWQGLCDLPVASLAAIQQLVAAHRVVLRDHTDRARALVDPFFSLDSVNAIVQALQADGSAWAQDTLAKLRQRSPLMLNVTLAQLRRARGMSLASDLRMERDMVHHCFNPKHLGKSPAQSETVEGIRAQAIDKDRTPRWSPPKLEEITPEMVAPFFDSPWTTQTHPLRHL